MRVPFLDLTAQYNEVKPEIDAAVAEIFATSAYVLGKWNRELEAKVAAIHGVRHGIAVNSGTDALRIAMQACDIGPGDEVITTAFTFVASVETIVQLGATPVFVDIDEATYNMDPSKVAAAVTSRTKAIMPIHLFGQLANVSEIERIAKEHGLTVVEDAAQAVGNHYEGKAAGNWGRAAGLSFYVTKNLGAAGDGGLILTNDDEVKERSLSLRIHGMGRERYYYDEVGYTSRMAELQAAVLTCKLARLDDWNRRRGELAEIYLQELSDEAIGLPVTSVGNNHTFHQFTVRHPQRDQLMAFLKENEIDSGIYYPVPLHLHKPYASFGKGAGSLPVTEKVSRECLSLPIHQHLSDEQAQFAASQVAEFCRTAAVTR
ncbi:MAG: DegT/DnrJ/EryC1/StrS family aminotransferase [Armatimonadetes bacterium]|nr:DegT/DnrJ/EryC1/StrS family aminotransferase [Armatimonadota bacterium]